MKRNSFKKLLGITLASVSAGMFLNFPAQAVDLTLRGKDFLVQGTPSQEKPSESTPSQGKPSESTPSQGKPSESTSKDSQAVKNSDIVPGGWLCLNNPNPQCRG